jgi:hypothetical protein
VAANIEDAAATEQARVEEIEKALQLAEMIFNRRPCERQPMI